MSGGWDTIESDAGVFTYLAEGLGAKDVQFEELFSLDQASLEALSPIYGVIFLFKISGTDTRGALPDGTFDHDAADSIFFAKQTIQNACGTQALLSLLLNASDVDVGPHLREFREFTTPLPPDFRGECLGNSELIRGVHNSFARASPFADETMRPATDDDDLYHFVAYAPVNGVLYELDGLREAPISHGACAGWAEFPARVAPVIERRIARHPAGEIRFNLIALVRDPRIRAREIGDVEALRAEEKKRKEWMVENALRRHNFVPFVAELMKGVVRAKKAEGGESYAKWIEEAKGKTMERIEKGRKAKGITDD